MTSRSSCTELVGGRNCRREARWIGMFGYLSDDRFPMCTQHKRQDQRGLKRFKLWMPVTPAQREAK